AGLRMPQLPQLPPPGVARVWLIVGPSGVRAEEVNPYSFAKSPKILWATPWSLLRNGGPSASPH
ncbi:MAG: hypothetical protein ACRDKB_10745, partial [Actinomycetota bacterium]